MERIVERILEFSRSPNFGCRLTGFAKLAPGIIAVTDTMNECDVYFDTDLWEFTHPEIWANSSDTTPSSARVEMYTLHHIQILSGLGQLPAARTFTEMMTMARMNLQPKTGCFIAWLSKPQILDVLEHV